MTEFATISRRRTSDRNSNKDPSSPASTSNIDNSTSTPPSRIPIKSPARSTKPIGGMAVAYSPLKSGTDENSNYSKKLLELKNAMDLLKTPPAATPSQSHAISYTPIKSSSLAAENHSISPFTSAIDSIEISMATSSSSDNETYGNDNSLLDAYREDDDSFVKRNIFSSPHHNSVTSSPYISSEELKKRLEATKEAFQRSLDAQKLRLRNSLPFHEMDSSFNNYNFDSDLSLDSLRDTKDQLERIRKEMAEIIESDLEDVETIRAKNKQGKSSDIILIKKESLSSILLKYFVIFSIATIIFTHLFITYMPSLSTIQSFIKSSSSSFDKETFLEKIEDILNFLLQDD